MEKDKATPQQWLDGELWNFVRGAAIDLEIPLKSQAEEQLYWHMKQACGVYGNVIEREKLLEKATPQGTPGTQWIKPKFPAATPEEWREFGKKLTTPDQCPQCGSKDFWTVLPACHGGKAHKWHSKEK
jgi:hypothetical protein